MKLPLLPLLSLLLLLPLLLLQEASALAAKPKKGKNEVICRPIPLELVFALDVSSSLTRDDLASLKGFVVDIVGRLPFGDNATRPAAITFSTNATIESNLGDVSSQQQFQQRVQAIPFYRGFTATGLAMQLARNHVFTRARPGAQKLLVVVTDGRTNHPGSREEALRLLRAESAELRMRGVRIHAVGVGQISLKEELKEISGGEDYSMVANFAALSQSVPHMMEEICEVHCPEADSVITLPGQCLNGTQRVQRVANRHLREQKQCVKMITDTYRYCGNSQQCRQISVSIGDCVNGQRPILTTWEEFDIVKQRCVMKRTVRMMDCKAVEECKEPVADLMFVLDSSGSMKKHDWTMQREFVRRLVQSMKVGPSTIRVGVSVFGTKAWTDIYLGKVKSKNDLLKKISKLKQRKRQWTNTGEGIRRASYEFQKRGRKGVRKLAIIMTDGESNRGPNAILEASMLEKSGVTILVVGVGKKLNRRELEAIATPPVEEHLFYAGDFNKLLHWVSKVSQESCEIITPPKPSLCDLPPKRVISSCYKGLQKVTVIRFQYDSTGQCSKTLLSQIVKNCPLLCTDPINGNQYYEGEKWTSECKTFVCRRNPVTHSPLRPILRECQSADNKCMKPTTELNFFKCHDEKGKLYSRCLCRAGGRLRIITADASRP